MRRLIIALVLVVCALYACAAAETDVHMAEYIVGHGYKAQLAGSVDAKDTIQVLIYNERTCGYDADITVPAAQGIAQLNAALQKIPMTPGEKRVYVIADGKTVMDSAFYTLGAPADCKSLTSSCRITVNGDTKYVTDGSIHTTNRIGKDGVKVEFPEGFGPGHLVLNWRHYPESGTVQYFDRSGRKIGSEPLKIGYYVVIIPFGENVGAVFVDTPDPEGSLADVYVYGNELPSPVQQWQDIRGDLDIMFISTHQDDELLFFGGAIGYYSNSGYNTAVVYMADCGIARYYEAMSGLWVLGVKNNPVFLGYTDFKPDSLDEARRRWAKEGDPVGDLVELFRKHRPSVVVCQDYNGEYGHYQHIYTAKVVTDAVKAAMDPEQYPESCAKYGIWEVPKFYVHLYDENVIHIKWDELEVPGLGGISSLDLDKVAYNRHQSQLKDFSVEKQGVKYDCTKFGLVYSAVGADVLKNDFFENIGG